MDEDVKSAIVGHVEEGMKGIPTTEMLGNMLEQERPIPRFNKDAEQPEEVYKREDLIEDAEWEALWVSDWVKANSVATYVFFFEQREMGVERDLLTRKQEIDIRQQPRKPSPHLQFRQASDPQTQTSQIHQPPDRLLLGVLQKAGSHWPDLPRKALDVWRRSYHNRIPLPQIH